MSHELRAPLNAILGFSEALKDGLVGPISDAQREYIGDIFTSGQYLLSLINDIVDFSKIEAGSAALNLEAVDLKSLLPDSLTIVRERAAAKHITLGFEIGEDLGVPQLDMRKTKQIVYNLLSNAVKFTANGGRVTLRARRVPRSAVGTHPGTWPVRSYPLADNEHAEFLEISVIDTGSGISVENMANVFHAFSQIDSDPARRREGTGLGLAMVKQLAELHGGAVAAASAEGEGSRFIAWLPLRVPAGAAVALPRNNGSAALATAGPRKRMALVIDDDDRVADLIGLLLQAEGFGVLRAISAEHALVMAPQQALGLITLDLQMYGMNGWQFLKEIRENSELAQVPVVIISGQPVGDLAIARGAAAVMQKPISRAQLKAALLKLGLVADRSTARSMATG
jgi:CheY-like chemotaxis protein/anti-sigma regulatory factor (Ser/Thr protein kinase)